MARPLLSAPSDPAVALRQFPGGRGPQQTCQHVFRGTLGTHQVAQVGAEGNAVALVMITGQGFPEQRAVSRALAFQRLQPQRLALCGPTAPLPSWTAAAPL